MNKEILLSNIDKVHTTEMGIDRIKRNLNSCKQRGIWILRFDWR